MHAGLQGTVYHKVSDDGDDAASDCSTVTGNQDSQARHNDDSASDCYSDSAHEVETLMIFDWDDTLFPTTWTRQHDMFEEGVTLSNEQKAQLEQMAERARLTLQMAMQIGKVVIVTNAEQGWIEMSCKTFMPSLVSLMKTVDIVSARSMYERLTPDASEWKRMAFEEEVELFYGTSQARQQRNIVSVGDSLHEMQALKAVTEGVSNCCGKSIKLRDFPSIEQLIEQHELLSTSFLDVVEHNGHLDVEIGVDNSE